MASYLLFLFPKILEAHTTMALAHHPTPVLPIRDFWCLYLTEFPWSEHHSRFFLVILLNLFPKASLTQSMAYYPFQPLLFDENLPFWGIFSLTLLRIHALSLGFSPFWDIGDLLYVVYHLSHPNTIRMCHLPAFYETFGFDSLELLIHIYLFAFTWSTRYIPSRQKLKNPQSHFHFFANGCIDSVTQLACVAQSQSV